MESGADAILVSRRALAHSQADLAPRHSRVMAIGAPSMAFEMERTGEYAVARGQSPNRTQARGASFAPRF